MSKIQWNPSIEHKQFIRSYAEALANGDAALFAGAGLSRPAGFVNWKDLLKDIAAEVGLEVDRETDLIAVAQYHLNARKTRGRINQVLMDDFNRSVSSTESHKILARLPIDTVWTTNYDKLLEQACGEAGKLVDVKRTPPDLARSLRGCDVTVYKMHGCVDLAHEAVLTKDDYEGYASTRSLFSDRLRGDLIGKTFLFLGFSFTDPNIDYILARVRTLLGTNQRPHFCVMRRPPSARGTKGKEAADREYARRKADLQQDDLLRFGIQTVWVDEYAHVELLLRALAAYANRRRVFVSGAAHDPAPFGQPRLDGFARALGGRLIAGGFDLISGFGLGLGEQCVLGALKAMYGLPKEQAIDRVIARPFPGPRPGLARAAQNTAHREDLLARAGCLVVLAGNKADAKGSIVNSDGVFEEVDIARRTGKFIIPVGASGHAAHEVWQQAMATPEEFLPGLSVKAQLKRLGNPKATDDELLDAVFEILHKAEAVVSRG